MTVFAMTAWSLALSVTRASNSHTQPEGTGASAHLSFPPKASLDRSKWEPLLMAHRPAYQPGHGGLFPGHLRAKPSSVMFPPKGEHM